MFVGANYDIMPSTNTGDKMGSWYYMVILILCLMLIL